VNLSAYEDAPDLLGENLLIDLAEPRDITQEIGLYPRFPVILVRAEFTFQGAGVKAADIDPDDFALHVDIDPPPLGYILYNEGLDPDAGPQPTFEWTDYEGDGGMDLIPDIEKIKADGHPARIVVRIQAWFKVDAPVVSQSRSDYHWLQSWGIAWRPSSTPFTWTTPIGTIGDVPWQQLYSSDFLPEQLYAGAVQLRICPSCDIFDSYGDAEEIRRNEIADIGFNTESISVEASTFWRPWDFTESILGWVILTIVGAVVTVIITWYLEARLKPDAAPPPAPPDGTGRHRKG